MVLQRPARDQVLLQAAGAWIPGSERADVGDASFLPLEENLLPTYFPRRADMPIVGNEGNEIVQTDFEVEVQARIDAERARLRAEAGLARMREFKKPVERTFTAAERDYVTILFGGLTWKHEEMIKAVFHGSGYHCENIPTPVVADFQAGKEFGNNGKCTPHSCTVGNLVRYLQGLEQQGLTRQQIIDNYVFFKGGSCGPCRFGMYEAEYRFALQNAG